MTPDAVALPAGYGFRRLATKEVRALDTLEDLLLVWEPPQPRHRYVLGVDVSDGIGQDRSVVDVCRVGTIDRPPEQVAQFVSRWIDPTDLAYVVDAVGRFYRDDDGFEALAAVETNNHGIATQAELQRRCGYQHFFIWRYEDAAPGVNPQTKRVGWYTTSRTRPIILSRFVKSVKTVDEITGVPDYQINSPFTMEEIRDFQTEGALFEAEAAKGATDDCLPPETLIRTRSGMKPICAVVVGEEVLTHLGRYRRVNRVGFRQTTFLCEIRAYGRPTLRLTANHRLLLQRRYRLRPTSSPLFHRAPKWVSVSDGYDLCHYASTSPVPIDVVDKTDVDLSEYAPSTYRIVAGDLVAYTFYGKIVNPKQNRLRCLLPVDANFCRMIGYYFAEGSRGAHNVAFASHTREHPIREWLAGYLQGLGLHPSVIKQSEDGWVLSAGSVPLNAFFAQFGSRAEKAFPSWVCQLPPVKQKEILVGYLLGDGCFRGKNGGITAVTISATAAFQLQEMALRCGWPVTLFPRSGQGYKLQWQLSFAGPVAKQIRAVIPPPLLAAKRPVIRPLKADQCGVRIEDGRLLGKIRSVKVVPYDGLVYNLDVEDDHSYVANGTIVHNCIMAAAIAIHVAETLFLDDVEPLTERRHRLNAERARAETLSDHLRTKRDYINTDASSDEATGHDEYEGWAGAQDTDL